MTRPTRILAALAIAVAAVAAPVATAGAAKAPRLTEVDAKFPDRAFHLTLPARELLTPDRVRVRENGVLMENVTIASAARTSPTILVIDASESMHDRAIVDATAAARAFIGQRRPEQAVGIVVFSERPRVLVQPTTDPEILRQALAKEPELSAGTHIYDATATALGLLGRAKAEAGSIVVLSDGADTGSRIGEAAVAAAAKRANARVYTVGLSISRAYSAKTLRELAAANNGSYTEVTSSKRLSRIFALLGAQLANEYLVKYRSTARLDSEVRVEAKVDGVPGIASASYTSPSLALEDATFQRTAGEKFWASSAWIIGMSGVVALLLFVVLWLALRSTQTSFADRVGSFVGLGTTGPEPGNESMGQFAARVLGGTERGLERTRWWAAFKQELEIARIEMPPAQLALATLGGTVVGIWMFATLAGAPVAGILGLMVPGFVRLYVKMKLKRQRKLFAAQLPDNLQVIGSAMRAGHSFPSALSVVVSDAIEPSLTEFQKAVADEKLGIPLEEALGRVARRMDSGDFDQVALVAGLQRETGGNSAEVIDQVTATVRERAELRMLVDTLTAQGRVSGWVVTLMPIGILAFLSIANPDYVEPLWTTGGGHIALFISGCMMLAGFFSIRKIVTIEV